MRRITPAEQDAYTRWRDYLAYLKTGKAKPAKRRTHRRERREGATEIRRQLRDDLGDDLRADR